jgi:hypothetical protein
MNHACKVILNLDVPINYFLYSIYIHCVSICIFIDKLDIFPLMCADDEVWITELSLIHKNIRSVRNLHVQEMTLILKIISQSDVKHILTSHIKTITVVLKISTYIITGMTAPPVRLAAILDIMYVSTFKIAIILYSI